MERQELIKLCELERSPEAEVQFDFCYTVPTTVNSYRGFYNHLAIGWESARSHWPLASDLANELRSAIGKTFEGYKGGDYYMDEQTPLWVANWGDTGSTAIDRIEVNGSSVIIHTKHAGW